MKRLSMNGSLEALLSGSHAYSFYFGHRLVHLGGANSVSILAVNSTVGKRTVSGRGGTWLGWWFSVISSFVLMCASNVLFWGNPLV